MIYRNAVASQDKYSQYCCVSYIVVTTDFAYVFSSSAENYLNTTFEVGLQLLPVTLLLRYHQLYQLGQEIPLHRYHLVS